MYYAFDNHIYSLSFMSNYVFPIWQTYCLSFMLITFETVHTGVSKKYKCPWSVKWQAQIICICKPYVVLYIYDLLHIPYLTVIFGFTYMTF